MGVKTHVLGLNSWTGVEKPHVVPTVVESTQAEGKSPEAISTIPGVNFTRVAKRGDIYTPMMVRVITRTASVGVYPPGCGEPPAGEEGSEWGFMTTRDNALTRPDDVGIWQRAMWGNFAPTQDDVIPESWRKDLMGADPLMWGDHTTNFHDWIEVNWPHFLLGDYFPTEGE